MDIIHILEELSYDTGELPREAIESAIAKRNEIAPHLLAILETAVNRIDEIIAQDNYQGHLYAMYLLAQFRDKRAYPLIINLISFPGEIPHAIAGDILTEDLGRILASVSEGYILPLQKLIENSNLSEYVRAAGLSALVTLVGCGVSDRKMIMAYFHSLFEKKLERRPSFVWDNLITSAIDLYPDDLYNDICKAFDDHLVDETLVDMKNVDSSLLQEKGAYLRELYQKSEFIDDTVTEMEKWFTPQFSV